ncbi:MAG: hypothetical protein HYV07_18410 [Deltaproteobacteria bacterium]|nr:hypothetical protein [Deltaproteobacteria bacterium]
MRRTTQLGALALTVLAGVSLSSCSDDSGPCETAADCDDGFDCTKDSCDGKACLHVPEDATCGDGSLCVPTKGCIQPPACRGNSDPRCDDGQACTTDLCDAQTGRCKYTTDDDACQDGAYCNGAEACVPFAGCQSSASVACSDSVACTVDACDETTDACSFTPDDRLCSDGSFCNGAEVCVAASGCTGGTAPDCDDQNVCTDDLCSTDLNACVHSTRDGDSDGEPGRACGGTDCNDADPAIFSAAPEACNELDDNCNGRTDEGVLSECGDCDFDCHQTTTGTGAAANHDFDPDGLTGTSFSAERGGIVVVAVQRASNDLWVPNTNESTLSRWDAATAQEMGRYRVGLPSGECPNVCCWSGACNMASRTVVDSDGDAYVASRGFNMLGSVTKVYRDPADCVDRNQNGFIDTSSTARPMPWNEDECVAWTATVGTDNALLRALAIDLGDEQHPEGYPWVGSYNTRKFWKLDPDTGRVLLEVDVPLRAYGATVTQDGRLWVGVLDEGATAWIDTTLNPPVVSPRIQFGLRSCASSYGITADQRGRLWFSGWDCRDALGYNPATGEWTRVDFAGYGISFAGRGITVDANGVIWMAIEIGGQSFLSFWHSDLFAPNRNVTGLINMVRLPDNHRGPSGVGADTNGKIWVGHHETSQLVRIDSETGQMESFTGPNRIYTYTDFTGAVRRAVVGRGFYVEDHDAGCANPTWDSLSWSADVPPEATLTFRIRTASDESDLPIAPSTDVVLVPGTTSPVALDRVLRDQGVIPDRYIRVVVQLETSVFGVSPALHNYTLRWHCN